MEKNVERLMKKTKKELVEIILKQDEEILEFKNNIESKDKEILRLNHENNKLRIDLQKANENVSEHQAGMDSITTEKEILKNELITASKRNKSLSNWCVILSIISIIFVILLLAF